MPLKVQTVLGCISPDDVGKTLTHEHFSLTFDKFYVPPPRKIENYFGNRIELTNVGFIRQYPYSSKYNVEFCDNETHTAVEYDVNSFKNAGGGTIVENTSHGLGRNISLMKDISVSSGIHVVAGTGYYVAHVQPQSTLQKKQEALYNTIVNELTAGCQDHPSVKCGFIGEVGSGWPLHDFEIRAIRATAEAQAQLGCPVSFHPGRSSQAPFEIMRLFLEAGGRAEKTIMSHLDRTLVEDVSLLEFSNFGAYCQFDLFGVECSYYQLHEETDMPSDAQRLNKLKTLIANGKLEQILVSHDIHTKHRLTKFGGHGFAHILQNVTPKMLIKGFSQEVLDQILIKNPSNWLKWNVN